MKTILEEEEIEEEKLKEEDNNMGNMVDLYYKL